MAQVRESISQERLVQVIYVSALLVPMAYTFNTDGPLGMLYYPTWISIGAQFPTGYFHVPDYTTPLVQLVFWSAILVFLGASAFYLLRYRFTEYLTDLAALIACVFSAVVLMSFTAQPLALLLLIPPFYPKARVQYRKLFFILAILAPIYVAYLFVKGASLHS